MKKIAILTSGGDAPGMNAHIRSVVRSANYNNLTVFGVMNGYEGLIDGEFIEMKNASVANVIQRGGTILKTARSKRFLEEKYRKQAYNNLVEWGIDGLIVCGGDGSFTGAQVFENETGIKVIGTPGTIDNDLYGTDFTIGFDTAINTVVEAIDKIRDTADAHGRIFFIEVMGRSAGYIAMHSGIGSGAEAIFVPEKEGDYENFVSKFEQSGRSDKLFSIIVVAEGDESGGAIKVAEQLKQKFSDISVRVSILGHIQRGGNPSCRDRVLASRLGAGAVEALINGKSNGMIGEKNNEIVFVPFTEALGKKKESKEGAMLDLIRILSL